MWHRRLRVWVYYLFPDTFWDTTLGFWLYQKGVVLDGEPEDCWVGGYELGPDD